MILFADGNESAQRCHRPNDGFLRQLAVFQEASFRVSRHDKATRMYYLERVVEEVMSEHLSIVPTPAETDTRAAQTETVPSKRTSSQSSRARRPTPPLPRRVGPAAASGAKCAARSSPRANTCLTMDRSALLRLPSPRLPPRAGHRHPSTMALSGRSPRSPRSVLRSLLRARGGLPRTTHALPYRHRSRHPARGGHR